MAASTETLLSPLLPVGSVYLDNNKPLSPQIIDDLKCRLLSGQYPQNGPLPTSSAMTEFYGVSDQHIYGALSRLIKDGWIVKEGYGKYRVATIIPPPVESVPPPVVKDGSVVRQKAETTRLLYCPTCGIWTQLDATVLAAIPSGMTLACVADASVLIAVELDPAKRK